MIWVLILSWILFTGAKYEGTLEQWLKINQDSDKDKTLELLKLSYQKEIEKKRAETRDFTPVFEVIEEYLLIAFGKPLHDIATPAELAERMRWLEEADTLLANIPDDEMSYEDDLKWDVFNQRIQSLSDMFQARADQLMNWHAESREVKPEHILDLIERYLDSAETVSVMDIHDVWVLSERMKFMEGAGRLLMGINKSKLSSAQQIRWLELNLRNDTISLRFQTRHDQLIRIEHDRNELRKIEQSA